MDKADINGVATQVLIQHYQRLGGQMEPSSGPPTLKGSKQVHSIYPSLEELKKPEGEDCDEESDQKSSRLMVRQINQGKD